MEQELAQFTAIYAQIVAYLVEYSFQIVGAVIVFLIGLFISRRVGALILALCKRKNLDIRTDVRAVVVECDPPAPYQVDGDHLGASKRLRFTWTPDHLSLVVPAET